MRGIVKNSRKTKCGAKQFPNRLVVRVAPFALLRDSPAQRSLARRTNSGFLTTWRAKPALCGRLRRRAKKDERGFALLLVFLLASAVALMLYRQMPREAFESERDKEQMLIDRGEQYKRAIYIYYVSNSRQWPAKIENLENTNNHRYLRHRYIDPYTGKDEWRLVHTNGVFLTDSLVTPPPAQATPGSGGMMAGSGGTSTPAGGPLSTSTSTGTPTLTASTADPNAPPEVNAQVQRRPSDRNLVQNSDFQNPSGGVGNDPGYQPFNPASLPPISLYPNGYNAAPTNVPGANGLSQSPYNLPGQVIQPGQPGFNQPGIQPGMNQPGLIQTGIPGFTLPGSPVAAPGITPPTFNPTTFNQPGNNLPLTPGTNQIIPTQFPAQQVPPQDPNQPNVPGNVLGFGTPPIGVQGAPGAPGAAPSNQAIGLINNLLTTPRQPPAGVGQQAPTGGGLAGVASTYKGAAIKSYMERTKYQEWEFVFQLPTQGAVQAPSGGGPNGPQLPGGPGGGPGVGPGGPGGLGAPGGSTAPGNTSPGTTGGGFRTN